MLSRQKILIHGVGYPPLTHWRIGNLVSHPPPYFLRLHQSSQVKKIDLHPLFSYGSPRARCFSYTAPYQGDATSRRSPFNSLEREQSDHLRLQSMTSKMTANARYQERSGIVNSRFLDATVWLGVNPMLQLQAAFSSERFVCI